MNVDAKHKMQINYVNGMKKSCKNQNINKQLRYYL